MYQTKARMSTGSRAIVRPFGRNRRFADWIQAVFGAPTTCFPTCVTWPILRPGRGDPCRRDGRWRPEPPAIARSSLISSPIRLVMVTAPWRTGLPSGQPAMARMCCSNCEIVAPSSVQCPELCTRGAISLTRTFGPAAASPARTSRPRARRHSRAHRRSSGDRARLRGQRVRHMPPARARSSEYGRDARSR